MLVGPLLWWAGVADTASAAQAALRPGDASLPYFVSNYRSGGLTMAGVFGLLNLLLVLALVPTARRLRAGGTGVVVQAVVAAVLVTGLALFEFRLDPVTHNWSGDPDAWSLVEDHLAPWYPSYGVLWLVVSAGVAALIAVRAVTDRQTD